MKAVDERYRDRKTQGLASDSSYGNNGWFVFPHFRINTGFEIRCMVSDGMGWEHVSVSVAKTNEEATRCPTWEEMCWVKDKFFFETECVVQFHPPRSEYVNCHKFCLHLWKKVNFEFETPPSIMVGLK